MEVIQEKKITARQKKKRMIESKSEKYHKGEKDERICFSPKKRTGP